MVLNTFLSLLYDMVKGSPINFNSYEPEKRVGESSTIKIVCFLVDLFAMQLAKCVNECKTQAANAKELFNNIKVVEKQRKSSHKIYDTNQEIGSDEDIAWDTDFDDSDDENEEEADDEQDNKSNERAEYSLEQNSTTACNNSNGDGVQLLGLKPLREDDYSAKPIEVPIEKESPVNSLPDTEVKPSTERIIPLPPPLPVITSSTNINALFHKPYAKAKRPLVQPPPPPISATPSVSSSSSDIVGMEDYESPINVITCTEVTVSNKGVWTISRKEDAISMSSTDRESDSIDQGTYELIDQEECTYEIVDDPNQREIPVDTSTQDRPVLPPRSKANKHLPAPPLPDKPKKYQPKPPQQTSSAPSIMKKVIPNKLSQVLSSTMFKDPARKNSLPALFDTKNKSDTGSENGELNSSKSKCNSTTSLTRSDSSLSNEELASRPLPSLPDAATEPPLSCPTQGNLFQQVWFHDITRENAEIKLRELNHNGGFVVRPSKMAGPTKPYTLSLLFNNSIFNLNIRIRQDGLYALGYEKTNEMQFNSIAEIVEFHKYKPIILTKKNEIAGKTFLTFTPNK